MGNKLGKFRKRSRQEDRQRLLKSNDDEDNSVVSSVGEEVIQTQLESVLLDNMMTSSNVENDEEAIQTESPVESIPPDDLTETNVEKDVPVENELEDIPPKIPGKSSNPVENAPPGNLPKSSNIEKDPPVENLLDISDVGEDEPLENAASLGYAVDSVISKTLAQDLNDLNATSLKVIIKFAESLKNLSLENMSVENLVKLLNAGEDEPFENSGPLEDIYCLRVFVRDCYVSHYKGTRCSGKLKYHEVYGCARDNDIPTCLTHITNYNSQRKKILDFTLVSTKFTRGVLKYIIYLWDGKYKTWRLMIPDSTKSDLNKCFPEPETWAQTINCSENNFETLKFLSQTTLPTKLPPSIIEALDSETHLTTYNFKLEKVMDVTLAEGRKYDDRTEFYIEWRGLRSGSYCFTVPDDGEPYRE